MSQALYSIFFYCLSSILMTLTNKLVLSSFDFKMNFLFLAFQVCCRDGKAFLCCCWTFKSSWMDVDLGTHSVESSLVSSLTFRIVSDLVVKFLLWFYSVINRDLKTTLSQFYLDFKTNYNLSLEYRMYTFSWTIHYCWTHFPPVNERKRCQDLVQGYPIARLDDLFRLKSNTISVYPCFYDFQKFNNHINRL